MKQNRRNGTSRGEEKKKNISAAERSSVADILMENRRRHALIDAPFDPLTGEGAPTPRRLVEIPDFILPRQYLPESMLRVPLLRRIIKDGTVEATAKALGCDAETITEALLRLRYRHDFTFWAYCLDRIKPKEITPQNHGEDIPFRLNRQQRRLVEVLEEMRLHDKPIRLILLKARQWGGSTVIQAYMAWLQLVHLKGLNSIIIAHLNTASANIRDMYRKLLRSYPPELLHDMGESYDRGEEIFTGDALTRNVMHIPSRNCKIVVGSAQSPDTARSSDISLAHLSEVAIWKEADKIKPEELVRSTVSGIALRPYTMIVYESTANGEGNFFQREYLAAKKGESVFRPHFVPWWQIEQYETTLDDPEAFALELYRRRLETDNPDGRRECGAYYWRLYTQGATLEAIHWYQNMRRSYRNHNDMASEYPSDDVEAFTATGSEVFDPYKLDELKKACTLPIAKGEIEADATEGNGALQHLRFISDTTGRLQIWEHPEEETSEPVAERYLTVVDIGGRSAKADFSVICVIDRYWMMEGERPCVVAQWRGHTDMDLLAWKAAQIAAYYNQSLLVIESNTLETKDRDRIVDGDQMPFILSQIKEVYPNLYARRQSQEDIREGAPVKYGFHTNTATKPMIISFLVKAIREKLYAERSAEAVEEMRLYERKQNGTYGAKQGYHDDMVMTRAIGLWVCYNDMERPHPVIPADTTPAHRDITEATI